MNKEYRIDDLIGSEELYHHGIKGQKWGVRRFQDKAGSLTAAGKKRYAEYQKKEKAYQAKLKKISKHKNISDNERQLVEYRSKSMSKRYGGLVVGTVIGDLINASIMGALSGKPINEALGDYAKNFDKRIPSLLAKNAMLMAKKDYQAKLVSERFTDEGKKRKGADKGLIKKEDVLDIAEKVLPYAITIGGMKMADVNRYKKDNKANFEKWGGNILESKYSDIVNLGEDSYRVTSERDAHTNYRPGAVKDAAKNAYKNVNQFANDFKYANEYERRKKVINKHRVK